MVIYRIGKMSTSLPQKNTTPLSLPTASNHNFWKGRERLYPMITTDGKI